MHFTSRRDADHQWQVIDLFTGETLGWYDDDLYARIDHPHGVSILYRPVRRKVIR